jgi:protein-L-isoaspartate(D-aspartate) O-methyltransferase
MAVNTLPDPATQSSDIAIRRQMMIDSQLRPSDVIEPRLIAAISSVDREAFVPAERAAAAYADRAIPLVGGRALNPPLATARLIADLAPQSGERVLLIGAATGYAAAVLAAMNVEVIAVEEAADLVAHCRRAAPQVELVEGPLAAGAAQHAPFAAMLIDGAVEMIPQSLLAQLADGGRFVTGLADGPVTRLARGVRVAGSDSAGLLPFADSECVVLPGFARPRGFSF